MFFDSVLNNSKHILNYASLKSSVVSSNISNLNNPEYKRKYVGDISFEDTLNKQELQKSHTKHLDSTGNSEFQVYVDTSLGRNDSNNVNLDKEIIDLSKATYLFKATSEVVSSQYKMITESLS